jgi:ArsR family transcriptional regulator, virulence genes transcriptional regulator
MLLGGSAIRRLRSAMLDTQDEGPDIARLAAFLAAMSNINRLGILHALREGEKPVHVLVDELGLSQSALSQHLKILRAHEIVSRRQQAQQSFYSIRRDVGSQLISTLTEMLQSRRKRPPKLPSDG